MKNKIEKHFFWKYAFNSNSIFPTEHKDVSIKIDTLVSCSYLFILFIVFLQFNNIKDYEALTPNFLLWPVLWVNYFDFRLVLNLSVLVLFFSSLLAAFKPYVRWFRIIVFVTFLIFTAIINSYVKINHIFHNIIVILFGFIFFPKSNDTKSSLKKNLVFASIQFFILFTYSISGLWKVAFMFKQFFS